MRGSLLTTEIYESQLRTAQQSTFCSAINNCHDDNDNDCHDCYDYHPDPDDDNCCNLIWSQLFEKKDQFFCKKVN